ncbi:hypothetical protein GA830_10585 [Mesorhizobium sp. NBSH29]|uniref:hypothetical protein n=1 Tax=Mesorhizobium sp. NBSH29 TaxID=2654249 RepID=UPI0018969F2B|nr:hypothetical protein [Mesorhizobium sp. NBSH29]QPC87140.1 hypothetical protein GA830_10585 [Mesorhizobium sp. NBSH29]
MNPDRLVVRLAAVSALNNFMQAPYPTLAGDKIFDSRIEPVEDFKEDVMFPVCVVYTDYDRDHWDHHTSMKKDRLLTVTFELLIAQVTETDGGFTVNHPNTDSELETSLDIFELQIANAFKALNPAADCFRHLMNSYVGVISRRGATIEGGTKLAARQITVESKVTRGPTNGTMVPAVAAFLDELEMHNDFGDRVPAIRSLYTDASSLTASEQMMRSMGWPSAAAGLLGYQAGPVVTLGTPVVFLNQNGSPL